MTMSVVPNADGSFTVKCNGVKMVVGGSPPPRRKLPKKPEPNDGGFVAYLHVGAPTIDLLPLDSPFTEVPPSAFTEAAPGARVTLRTPLSGPTVVELQVPPGTPLDMERLQAAVQQWRLETGQDAELHIHVGHGGANPLHIATQFEIR